MTTPLTAAQRATLERLAAEAWPAPWVAHTFEIDCPCPNGEHCGDSHTCEQVEAPEAYPASPDDPAAPGDGQCVVQISVPGLESLARPTAEFIAAARNHLPALLTSLRAAEAEVERLQVALGKERDRASAAEAERDALRKVVEDQRRELLARHDAMTEAEARSAAAEALLTEARAWGEEQRRQASEHYERAETAEAARASLDLAVTEALKDRDAYERGEREAREALRECREAAAGGDAAIRPEQTAAGVRALAAMVQEGLALRARMRTVADHLGDLANLDRRSITSIRSAYGHAQELVLHALLAPATTKETP